MKHIIIITIFLAFNLFSGELKIKAKTFNADQKSGISIFEGDVNIIKGTDELNASKVTVYTDSNQEPIKFVAEGSASFTIQTLEGSLYKGKAEKVIYMPKEKVVFAGDLVMNGRVTSNRDGSVVGQIDALNKMDKLDWSTMIPGHGFIIDRKADDESIMYFSQLKEQVEAAMENDIDETEIVETVKMEYFKDKNMYDLLHALNVSRTYLEFDMGLPEHEVVH